MKDISARGQTRAPFLGQVTWKIKCVGRVKADRMIRDKKERGKN